MNPVPMGAAAEVPFEAQRASVAQVRAATVAAVVAGEAARAEPATAHRCAACGLPTPNRLCAFDARTVELIKRRRCVACKEPVFDADSERVEGRCAECRTRQVRVCDSTRWLLRQAAKARTDGRSMLPLAA